MRTIKFYFHQENWFKVLKHSFRLKTLGCGTLNFIINIIEIKLWKKDEQIILERSTRISCDEKQCISV